ncbi:DUF998 domain-containing protein [Nonomuraea sp. NPDC026600]|uniref:DUF998 domain-containing protein n=1 Tax=Nonomuraea sp. NPDC026600 TaxID=3155363 RepID=UPI0033F16BF2
MTDVWAALSIASVALCVAAFGVLHLVAANMSPIERTLSEYALTAYRWLYSLAVGSVVLAVVLLAVGLYTASPGTVPTAATVLLGVFAVAMLVAAVFRTDFMDPHAGEFAMTHSGVVHAIAGFIAGLALCAAAPLLDGSLTRLGASHEWTAVMSWTPTAGLAIFLVTIVARGPLHRLTGRVSVHGIGERLGFAACLAWLGYAAISLVLAT